MKFVTFVHDGSESIGVLTEDGSGVRPLAGTDSLESVIAERPGWPGQPAEEPVLALADIRLRAPIPRPGRNIICVGKNYAEHAAEFERSGVDGTAAGSGAVLPIFFTKAPSTVIGPDDIIEAHQDMTSQPDYEAELCVIIGTGGRGITRADALEHVWGYTIVNDVTARDLQHRHQQWFLGKSLDGFCPMGPWAVTADEVDVGNLDLVCSVNGEVRQRGNTKDLIHDVPTLISTLSAGITLQPGDLIATGTPAGVGIGFDPPRFLQPGDEITIEITGLGRLTNTFGTRKGSR